MAVSDHPVYEGPQSKPGDGRLHMDWRTTQQKTLPPVTLGTHSSFHQTWSQIYTSIYHLHWIDLFALILSV